jgi:hypothetical protein
MFQNQGGAAMTKTDRSVTKVTSAFSPHGAMGQKYLASGVHVAMRLWENEPESSCFLGNSR